MAVWIDNLSSMWRRAFTSVSVILSLMAIPAVAHASQKPDTPCSKAGKLSSFSGTKYRCTLSGKKLIWVSAIVKSSPSKEVKPVAPQAKLEQSIIVPTWKGQDISTGTIAALFSASSKLPVGTITSTADICAVQNTVISLLQTGTCTLSATQPGNDKYLPALPVTFSFQVEPPIITSDSPLLDEVQTFVRVPQGSTYVSDTAEITLTSFVNDATSEVCADDASQDGCILVNGAGTVDPASQTRYVEFKFHVKDLDPNPLPTISYRLLLNGVLSDIDTAVSLPTLNNMTVESNGTADGSLFARVPLNMKLNGSLLMIDEGITDSSIRVLLGVTN